MHKNIFFSLLLSLIVACRPYSQEIISFEPSNLGNIPDSTTTSFGTDYDKSNTQISIFIYKENTKVGQGFLTKSLTTSLECDAPNTYNWTFSGADNYTYLATSVGNVAKGEIAQQWNGTFTASKDSACKPILLSKNDLIPLNERAKAQFWLKAGTSTGFQSGDTTTLLVSIFRPDNSKVVENLPLLATATGFKPLCEPSNNYPFAILSLPLGTYFAQIKYAGITKNIPNFTLASGICTVIDL